MTNFRHRVSIETPLGALLYMADEAGARALLETKRAVVHSYKAGAVNIVRLRDDQAMAEVVDLRLWPGSYGIERDLTTVPGRLIYRHKNTREKELAA